MTGWIPDETLSDMEKMIDSASWWAANTRAKLAEDGKKDEENFK